MNGDLVAASRSLAKADQHWMSVALEQATEAGGRGEVPVGAVLVLDGQSLGQGFNQPISLHDPTAHAEIVALRDAARTLGNYRLPESTLYVTLEPCLMCAGAILQARIKRVVFGARDPKAGAVGSIANLLQNPLTNHQCEVTAGVLADECSRLMSGFFSERRRGQA